MIIVRIRSGLGNQMFQYALYRTLLSRGKQVKMDVELYKMKKIHNGYELPAIFNINEIYATKKEINQYADMNQDVFNRTRRKVFGVKKKCNEFKPTVYEAIQYKPEIYDMDDIYINGYWQSELYFKEIENIIRNDFKFRIPLNKESKNIANQILNCNSISIHVRRGDYLRLSYLGKVCNLSYYQNALYMIMNKVKKPKFFIFSDDIQWCKANLKIKEAIYIDFNKGMDAHMDMHLMSLCKHNIIPNSTFSWWGAWLNNNPSKVVIAPERWFLDKPCGDIVPDNWITIKNV